MGRKSHSKGLSAWINGERVGVWIIPTRGASQFIYDQSWIDSPNGRPLSLSLPYSGGGLALKGERVDHYFDNLLPDSETIRRRIATRMKTASISTFDLLQAVGRDCVGAVQLLGEDEEPSNVKTISGTPLTDDEIERLIHYTISDDSVSLDEEDELRISLAGAQEKTALLFHDNRWMRPHGATPTTHILKLPLGLVGQRRADFSSSVENEWLCMHLLAAFGLPVAATDLFQFGEQKVLSVERFDRRLHSSGQWIMRLPQEDFCQVKGLPSFLKYESDGGPSLADLATILGGSVRAREDLDTLLKTQILFWMLAAPDGHAKNFSIRLLPEGRYSLAPLYDVMSIWPVEGKGTNQFAYHKTKMAMSISGKNKHYHFKDILPRHFHQMAAKHFQRSDATELIDEIISKTSDAITQVASQLPKTFPAKVAESIFAGVQKSANQLKL